eukprot:SAG31_NODE_123_length_23712_cov_41.426291_3_plen_33_part_00
MVALLNDECLHVDLQGYTRFQMNQFLLQDALT